MCATGAGRSPAHRARTEHVGIADLPSGIDHNQAEQALRASEERFRRYFELGRIGMAITSPSKGCVEANDELCRMLGYEHDELIKKTWAEMTHPEDWSAGVMRRR